MRKEYTFEQWQELAEKKKVYEYTHIISLDYRVLEPVSLTKINVTCPKCRAFLFDVNLLKKYEAACWLFHAFDNGVCVFCQVCSWRGTRLQGKLRQGDRFTKRFEKRMIRLLEDPDE